MNKMQAKKIEMTQVFLDDGTVVPVTRIEIVSGVDKLSVGDLVNVKGKGKGKGFAGVVKRYSFAGGPKTHGQSDRHRAPGSIGSGTFPGRVWKGQRMAGRMGGKTVTVRNLEVVKIEDNQALIKGGVPGGRHNLLEVTVVNSESTGKEHE